MSKSLVITECRPALRLDRVSRSVRGTITKREG